MDTNITDIFGSLLSGESLDKIATAGNIDKKTSGNLISQALPELLKGLESNTKTPEGMDSLLSAISSKHTGDIFKAGSQIDTVDGGKILGHILGEKKESLIGNLASSLNIGQEEAGNSLSGIAPLLLGALGKAKKDGKIDISSMGDVLSSKNISSQLLTSFIDKDGDGDIKDDLLNMGMNYLKKSFFKK